MSEFEQKNREFEENLSALKQWLDKTESILKSDTHQDADLIKVSSSDLVTVNISDLLMVTISNLPIVSLSVSQENPHSRECS